MLSRLDLNPERANQKYSVDYTYYDGSTFYQPLRWAINGITRAITGAPRYPSHIMPSEQVNQLAQKDIKEYTAKALNGIAIVSPPPSRQDLLDLAEFTLYQVLQLGIRSSNRRDEDFRSFFSPGVAEQHHDEIHRAWDNVLQKNNINYPKVPVPQSPIKKTIQKPAPSPELLPPDQNNPLQYEEFMRQRIMLLKRVGTMRQVEALFPGEVLQIPGIPGIVDAFPRTTFKIEDDGRSLDNPSGVVNKTLAARYLDPISCASFCLQYSAGNCRELAKTAISSLLINRNQTDLHKKNYSVAICKQYFEDPQGKLCLSHASVIIMSRQDAQKMWQQRLTVKEKYNLTADGEIPIPKALKQFDVAICDPWCEKVYSGADWHEHFQPLLKNIDKNTLKQGVLWSVTIQLIDSNVQQ